MAVCLSYLKIPFLSPTRCLLSLVFAKKKERCVHLPSPSSRAPAQDPLLQLTCCFGSQHAFLPASTP
jgi:hypothetical protein